MTPTCSNCGRLTRNPAVEVAGRMGRFCSRLCEVLFAQAAAEAETQR